MRKYLKQIIVFAVIVTAIVLFYALKLNRFFTYENIGRVKELILQYKVFGPIVIYALYIVFNLLCLPTLFFNFLSGYLYGLGWGYLLACSGMIIGLTCSFFGSRYLFRKEFQSKFAANKLVSTIDGYTQQQPLFMVIFFRIFFIFPYNMQNVAYGLTSIKPRDYIIGSAIGTAPITFLHVLLGYFVDHSVLQTSEMSDIFKWIGIFITVFACVFFTSYFVKKRFQKKNTDDKSKDNLKEKND